MSLVLIVWLLCCIIYIFLSVLPFFFKINKLTNTVASVHMKKF